MKVFLTRDYLQFINQRAERAGELCAAMPANIHAERRAGQLEAIKAESEAIAAAMIVAADHECAPVYSELRRRLVAIDAQALELLDQIERIESRAT